MIFIYLSYSPVLLSSVLATGWLRIALTVRGLFYNRLHGVNPPPLPCFVSAFFQDPWFLCQIYRSCFWIFETTKRRLSAGWLTENRLVFFKSFWYSSRISICESIKSVAWRVIKGFCPIQISNFFYPSKCRRFLTNGNVEGFDQLGCRIFFTYRNVEVFHQSKFCMVLANWNIEYFDQIEVSK